MGPGGPWALGPMDPGPQGPQVAKGGPQGLTHAILWHPPSPGVPWAPPGYPGVPAGGPMAPAPLNHPSASPGGSPWGFPMSSQGSTMYSFGCLEN